LLALLGAHHILHVSRIRVKVEEIFQKRGEGREQGVASIHFNFSHPSLLKFL
jgi:hypothetical protein